MALAASTATETEAANRTLCCSGCLIEAIERSDEATLRALLSARNVDFTDTYWAPRAGLSFAANYPKWGYANVPLLSGRTAPVAHKRARNECTHSMREQTLVPGKPSHVAMSVVLTAMLHATQQFDGLQLLLESRAFDLSEPLIFHWLDTEWDERRSLRRTDCNWHIIIGDAVGLAVLLDAGPSDAGYSHDRTYEPESPPFPLLRTLARHRLLEGRIGSELRLMQVDSQGVARWDAAGFYCISANHVLSFLQSCSEHCDTGSIIDFLQQMRCVAAGNEEHTTCLLRTLCQLGLSLGPHTRSTISSRNGSAKHVACETTCVSLLQSLNVLICKIPSFGAQIEPHVDEWIRYGWICVQSDDETLLQLIGTLHEYVEQIDKEDYRAAFRIFRQLLALGLFREPNPKHAALTWPQRCFSDEHVLRWYSEQHRANCSLSPSNRSEATGFDEAEEEAAEAETLSEGVSGEAPKECECSLLAPLVTEFFQKPLSLLQLSRMRIRQSLGMYDFESRVQTLPLPPALLTYVWRANEMLAKAPVEESDSDEEMDEEIESDEAETHEEEEVTETDDSPSKVSLQ